MFKCKLGEGAKDRYSGALNRFSGSWLCYNCPASPKSCPPNNYSPNGPHISRCLHHHSEGIFKAPNCTFNASLILWLLSDRVTDSALAGYWKENSPLALPGFRVKEGLGCVLFCAIELRKTRNLALPWLENPVHDFSFIELHKRWTLGCAILHPGSLIHDIFAPFDFEFMLLPPLFF